MSHGLCKVYTSTMASAASQSSEINLGRAYRNVYLKIPTMASSTDGMRIYASDVSGGTYLPVMQASLNSSTVTTNPYVIASAASQVIVPVPAGLQFLKVQVAAAPAAIVVFTVICSD